MGIMPGSERSLIRWALAHVLLVGLLPTAWTVRAGETMDLPTSKPEDVGVSSVRLQRIHEVVQRYIDGHRIAGAVTLVARRGKVIHLEAQGLADVETKAPVRLDTIFQMASCSKPVTGAAILMLIEEGKVGLSDPVSKFLPEFHQVQVAMESGGQVSRVPARREVTIRDLLTHTSGLATGGAGTKLVPPEWLHPGGSGATLTEGAARYAKVPLDFQPGELWRYSGLAGIDVLSRVVEVASGQSFEAFLQERMFKPLGMTDTFFHVPEDRRSRLAAIHKRGESGMEKVPSYIQFPETYSSGAGGLYSTASDFARFAMMLAEGGTFGQDRLLSRKGLELYSSNLVGNLFEGQANRPSGMGFGFAVEVVVDPAKAGTFRSAGSFGWDGAFGTVFWADPRERLSTVLLIQTHVRELHRDFDTAVMQSLVD